jgi:hypothetical protein
VARARLRREKIALVLYIYLYRISHGCSLSVSQGQCSAVPVLFMQTAAQHVPSWRCEPISICILYFASFLLAPDYFITQPLCAERERATWVKLLISYREAIRGLSIQGFPLKLLDPAAKSRVTVARWSRSRGPTAYGRSSTAVAASSASFHRSRGRGARVMGHACPPDEHKHRCSCC